MKVEDLPVATTFLSHHKSHSPWKIHLRPSFVIVTLSKPATITVLSSMTTASKPVSESLTGLLDKSAVSNYFRIASGVVSATVLVVPIITASGAYNCTIASTSDPEKAFAHWSTTWSASSLGPAAALLNVAKSLMNPLISDGAINASKHGDFEQHSAEAFDQRPQAGSGMVGISS